ncbi:MAG: hypothetical protein ACI3YC_02840 [Alloprevotella sp.]
MKYLAKLSFFVMMLFAGFAVAACGDDDPVVSPPGGEEGGGEEGGGEEGETSFTDPYLNWGATLAQLQAAKDDNLFDGTEADEDDPNITYAGYYGVSPINYEMYMFDSNALFGSYIEMKSNNIGGFENVLNVLQSRYTYADYIEDDDIYIFISADYSTFLGAYEVIDNGTSWSCVEYYDYAYLSSDSSAPAKAPAVKNGKKTHFKNAARFISNNNLVQKAPAFKTFSKFKGFKKFKF